MNLSNIKNKSATFRLRAFVVVAINILSVYFSSSVMAVENDTLLKLSPTQCIAIHQGKKCFVDVEVSWQASLKGKYCLYSSQQTKALKCWQQVQQGIFAQEIVAKENVLFMLKLHNSEIILSSKELEMAWVYKKNTRARSSWRMF